MDYNKNNTLEQLKKEMNYYKLDNFQDEIVTKYINENNLNEARKVFNNFKDENRCKLDKKVHLWIGIFLGLFVIPGLWNVLLEILSIISE